MERGLVSLSSGFEKFASSKTFTDFVAYVIKEGPIVGAFFEQLVGLVGRLLVGLAPVGDAILKILTPFVTWVNKMLTANPVFVTVIGTVLALAAALYLVFLAVSPVTLGLAALVVAAYVLSANWATFISGMKILWDSFKLVVLTGLLDIIVGLDDAFGWLPIIGPKLDDARNAVSAWVANVQGDLNSLKSPPPLTVTVIDNYANPVIPGGAPRDYQGSAPLYGPFIGGGSGGGHAAGGPISKPSIVGELGPELFIPGGPGYIVPNNQLDNFALGMSGGSKGPAMVVGEQHFHHDTDIVMLGQQLAFQQRAGRL